jgi:amidase
VFVLTERPSTAKSPPAIDDMAAKLERAGASVSRRSELLPSPAESQALVERFGKIVEAMKATPGAPPKAPCYVTPAFPHFSEPDPWPGTRKTRSRPAPHVRF